jgi:recombination protein RecT
MNAPATGLAVRSDNPIDKLKNNLVSRADEFKVALPSHISVEKFQRTIATAAMSNAQLLDCDRRSLLLAAMKLAQDGLLPDGREAALVPFKVWDKNTRQTTWQVQPMPMAYGLRKKILQSGQVISLETGVVYRAELEAGHFIYEIGMDPPIRHRPKLDLTIEETRDENIVAAYSIARIKSENSDPYWSVEVMRRSEVDKVRQASQTGALGRTTRDGKKIEPKGPWVEWYGEMAKKTVLRRHSKVLPMSGDIFETLDRDREEELRAEGAARLLDHEPDPVVLPSRDELEQSDEQVDVETGEVLGDEPQQDAATGMTEVDEETARQLDNGTVEAADEQAEGEADAEAETTNEPTMAEKFLADLRVSIEAASSAAEMKKVDANWTKNRAIYDDATTAEIDTLITARFKAVKEPA